MRYFRLFDFMSDVEGDLYRADGVSVFEWQPGPDKSWTSTAVMDFMAPNFQDWFDAQVIMGARVEEVEAP